MDTATEFFFGDGHYTFWLPLPQAVELERKCGTRDAQGKLTPKSIFTIYDELGAGLGRDRETGHVAWIGGGAGMVADVNEVLRLGLIGGNSGPDEGEGTEVGPRRAAHLVKLYGFPSRPLSEVAVSAWRVLNAAIEGIDVKKNDDPPVADPNPSTKAT